MSTHSTFGAPRTVLHTSYGWRALQDLGIREGIVAIPYEKHAADAHLSRLKQFLKYHLWTGSSAIVTCPSAMTDGAATLLRRHLSATEALPAQQREVFEEAYRRLTSRNPEEAWTSGQWMTERSGGSDVRGTETAATFVGPEAGGLDAGNMPLGPWSVSGFKWFSSATDSQMAVLLAATDKGGLSAFYAPMRRRADDGSVEMNGVSIQRLKPKLGTRPLPTAELVLDGLRAWLIGKEGEGVREIAAILNITRIHNAVSALGFWGRGLAISRAYARVRKVDGGLLHDNAAHTRTMARNTVSYAAHMHIGFFVASLLGISEQPSAFAATKDAAKGVVTDPAQAKHLLRLLTPVAKAQCSKQAIYGLQECMESLGGVGYIEDEQEFNVARLFRDACVLSIWEGTTDVMASDVIRVVKGRDGVATCKALLTWASARIAAWSQAPWQDAKAVIRQKLDVFEHWGGKAAAELRVSGRRLLELLAWIVASVLLVEDAGRGDCEVAVHLARSWLALRPNHDGHGEASLAVDKKIVFGE